LDIKRALAETDRRVSIIAEHYLRREIAREEALRRDARLVAPGGKGRLARNREHAELNRKLRAAGCRPVSSEPSLTQKMKKLQQLEARNRAETETRRRAP
jgi:hypothetical protein